MMTTTDVPLGWIVAWEDLRGRTHTSQTFGTEEQAERHKAQIVAGDDRYRKLVLEVGVPDSHGTYGWRATTVRRELRVEREQESDES